MCNVRLDGVDCDLELDSGASDTVISEMAYEKLWGPNGPRLTTSKVQLRDFQQKPIEIKGEFWVDVEINGKNQGSLPLIVTKKNSANLLGRNWFEALGINFAINNVQSISINALLQQYNQVFDGELGTYRGPPIKLELDPQVTPIALKARTVAFALRPKIERELDKLVHQGILEPVDQSEWATPIVPVVKADQVSIRLCGDYKCTVNKALKKDIYPMTNATEIFAALRGARVFGKLDMAQAYQQLSVDKESAMIQTIITHKGRYKVKRLQFGIRVAPQIFQQHVNKLVNKIPGIYPYYDDILVCAESEEQFIIRLREVLDRFANYGLKLNRKKCQFLRNEIEFLGCIINKHGTRPTLEKTRAIREAPRPRCKKELQSFLGIINFYHAFLKEKANVLEPLHRLLQADAVWKWTKQEEQAFDQAKRMLTAKSMLIHYDSTKEITLTCDASPWGTGSVLSHIQDDGSEAPIAYHSRTLDATQRRYAQIDKEALAIVVAVKKFHNYVFGRRFTIKTDHKPLLGLLGEDKPIPEMTSPRMVRWALFLSNYNYRLQYTQGKAIGHADALSRLTPEAAQGNDREKSLGNVLMLENVPEKPVRADKIAYYTARDPVLGQVKNFITSTWPSKVHDKFKPFYHRRDELSVYKECVLWGHRVIIPEKARRQVLDLLHATHVGMVRMKIIARSYCWWPKMDEELEGIVRLCKICEANLKNPAKVPIHHWEWETNPWTRLHVDFAGPTNGNIFFVLVDAYSKYVIVKRVNSTSANAAIRCLREAFSTFGLPAVVVSDNGTSFTAEEFKQFLRKNGIRHTLTPPYSPSTNGQAERMVQEVKRNIKKLGEGDCDTKIARYLLAQHSTPSTATGRTPAEMLMKRKLRTCFDLLHPSLENPRADRQENTRRRFREMEDQENVIVRNPVKQVWTEEQITKRLGPVTYQTSDSCGTTHKRHIDQMRRKYNPSTDHDNNSVTDWIEYLPPVKPNATTVRGTREATVVTTQAEEEERRGEPSNDPTPTSNEPECTIPTGRTKASEPSRRPTRTIKRPAKLFDFITDTHQTRCDSTGEEGM